MRQARTGRSFARRAAVAAAITALAAGGVKAMADTPTLDEMDKYVAKLSAQDLEILKNLKPHEIWVAPDGKPTNTGAKDSPVDLKTAYTNKDLVTPGTLVWITAGQYDVAPMKPEGICGTREQPIIFRAVPGVRATINGPINSNAGCDHIWWWGVEVAGRSLYGVETHDGGDDLKFINLFIHDHVTGFGGWDTGSDHEFYGNIVFRNGRTQLDHGFYTQNTGTHTAKRYVDNLVFENSGEGFQIYGTAPTLRNIYFEGNVSFATSILPRSPGLEAQMNVLIGGGDKNKPLTCVIVRNNYTYHPSPKEKRGVDIGYKNKPNTQILIENNYFTGGANAMELKNASDQVVVRNNTFWAPDGMVDVTLQPPGKVVFEKNTYIDNGHFDLAKFQASITSGETDQVVKGQDGRPADLKVFKRVNRYEPQRVHLAVYNWPKTPTVALDLADVLQQGQKFRIVEVHDLWAKPVVEGVFAGKPVEMKMAGDYAPEFGCYVLFRD